MTARDAEKVAALRALADEADDPKGAETWRGHHADLLTAYVATKQAEALSFAADEIRRAQEEVGFPANHDRGVNYSLTILDDLADRARAVREA